MSGLTRRGFLGWAGLVLGGLLAHHKPGHGHGRPPPPTTTTSTTQPGVDVYGDTYTETYEVAA